MADAELVAKVQPKELKKSGYAMIRGDPGVHTDAHDRQWARSVARQQTAAHRFSSDAHGRPMYTISTASVLEQGRSV